MAKLDQTLWRDMMSYLRRKHAAICRQWFEELQPLSLESGLLKVYTNNTVRQTYLQKKCVDHFNEAAQAATGALVAVRFVNNKESFEPVSVGVSEQSSTQRTGQAIQSSVLTIPKAPIKASIKVNLPPRTTSAGTNEHHQKDNVRFEEIIISPDYSFENFIPGPGNQLAYAAARAVADQPATAYNPLFIHGGVGLGKTHLLQAICQSIMQKLPDMKICYLSCDSFMNQFIECVQHGLMNEFRHRYRHVDVLVIDDIHFLANKERSQEEFFHTFNELYQSNRQIILSSDSPPSEIPRLEERLVSRFHWGMVTQVSRPDYETRVAIVRAKAKLRGLLPPDDVIAYIATRIDSNARELEGAITTIQGHAILQNKAIDLDLAKQVLGEPGASRMNNQVTLQHIIDVVTVFYNVKLNDLQSKRRHKSITMPRQVCMWLARKRTRFSLQEIGGYFGGRDHTTVMHSIQTVGNRISENPEYAQQINILDERISKSTQSAN